MSIPLRRTSGTPRSLSTSCVAPGCVSASRSRETAGIASMTTGFGAAALSAGALPSVKTAFSNPVSLAPATNKKRRWFGTAS